MSSGSSASVAGVVLVALIVPAAAQRAKPQAGGFARSELSLAGRTAAIAYAPDLKASEAAHQPLLSAAVPTDARVRVAQLETTGALRIGGVDLPGPDAALKPAPQGPAAVRYELWLAGASSGWQLRVMNGDHLLGEVNLRRERLDAAASSFVASLVPEDSAVGRLTVRWGGYQAQTGLQFINPLRRRTDENREANVTTNRTHDEDTSVLSRARLLAQRNETAMMLPRGQRVSISFQRTFAKGERPAGNRDTRGLGVDGPDFARLMQTGDGAVVMLTESSVPRLRTEAPLRFGNVTIATGNQVPGFPGSYGLWLKRAGGSWRLVFNHEPDAWGSQHDPKFDAAEVPLTYSGGHAASRPFAVAIAPTAADRGRFVIIWGPHEWTADFTLTS